ncbi:hypothetical protein GW571_11255 [Clavibacter capsici]|uniref:Uncharacterized protein n=1 Tax=Clavibacter capsici TaxID=1874630 RepID=A0A0M4HRU2_9MICO|nr:hypothetical protein [Clavibacter capsici]ALD13423.1 hypothetical protein AES38_11255 [Clavibacter capsici]QIS42673.1 hypothetical protein GW571_11255 [Clavibacter capsici]QIS45619.1 hypothetical protein GW570_11235 [Clavibacter capsici]
MSDIENPRDPADRDLDDTGVDEEELVGAADRDAREAIDAERVVPLEDDAVEADDADGGLGIDITESDGPDLEAGDDLDTGAAIR